MLNLEQTSMTAHLAENVQFVVNQLAALKVVCNGIAVWDGEGNELLPYAVAAPLSTLEAVQQVFDRVRQQGQLAIGRDGDDGFLVGYPLLLADQTLSHVFIMGLDAVNEQTVIMGRLAMGWLHLPFVQVAAERGREAIQLLDMQAHVFSQDKARAAAQEWVNRAAQWMRQGAADATHSVFYFRILDPQGALPRWWVTSDTASAEKGTASLHAATDTANRSALECRELQLGDTWSFPVMNEGEMVGVVVTTGAAVDPRAKQLVRASASVVGALLHHWHTAERGLWSHLLASLREAQRRLQAPGFLTWKLAALSVAVILGVLLLIPFEDRAVAKVVIEGQKQQMISAPFDGYWAEVHVRPGDQVTAGQLMARLDTQDIKAEQAKLLSERDQAAGKLREAFAEADSSAVQQASAQLRQTNAQLALVESKLQRSDIRAPADGVVIFGDWFDQTGSPVETGKKLFEIAAGSGYRVVLQMPEEEIARVELGQPGELRVTGLPQQQFSFRVNRVTAVAALDDHKNTFRIEAVLEDSNAPLRPGMQGVGKVVVAHNNLLTQGLRPVGQWLRMKIWAMWW